MTQDAGLESNAPFVPSAQGAFSRLKAILGGSVGNLVEWFDWYAYSAFALYFAPVFFPRADQTAQLLQAAGIFAVGFLARPVGAWLMGSYADKAGRRAALSLSVTMMCAGSLVIAVTPGFAVIGSAAPAILLGARLLQGLSVGGEYGASATYLSEAAGRGHRGFWSSFQYVTLIAGQLLALGLLILLQATLSPSDLAAFGWRIPFVIGALLAVVAFWMRRGLVETAPPPGKHSDAPRGDAGELIRRHAKPAGMIFGLTAAGSLGFYAFTTYLQKYLTNTAGFSKVQATHISAAALFLFMLVQPAFGALSDRVGRKPLLIAAFALCGVGAWPLMTALGAATSVWTALGLALLSLVMLSGYTATNAVVKAEMFPAHVRALGVALPYALANAVFGGTAEYVALWFKRAGAESGFFIYVSAMMALGLILALRLREPARHSRIED